MAPQPEIHPTSPLVLWELCTAGVAAEICQKLALHPLGASSIYTLPIDGLSVCNVLDTIKARLQYMRTGVEGRLYTSQSRAFRVPLLSDLVMTAQLYRGGTQYLGPFAFWQSLYRGLTPALCGVIPTSVVYMPTYELSVRFPTASTLIVLRTYAHGTRNQHWQVLVSKHWLVVLRVASVRACGCLCRL